MAPDRRLTMTMSPIDPGRLRTPFALQDNAPTTDALGGHADQWQTVADLWGMFERQRPTDPNRAADDEQRIEATILLRADPRVAQDMRLESRNTTWRIRTVHDPDGTGRYLRCIAISEASP